MDFSWDEHKNVKNFKKHEVWFEEAQSVFDDPFAREIPDNDHSTPDEERWLILGFSEKPRMLIVCYAELLENEPIRIISARKAEPDEEAQYRGFKDER
jgi:uncharacterized DUF497 family protein